MARPHHIQEDRLYEFYIAEQSGEPVDPSAADHIMSCTACRARYAEMSDFFAGVREEVDAEADEIFTHERLAAQQSEIIRRLDAQRSAKVISFPRHVTQQIAGTSSRVAPRWLAAAAAAGLFVGVAVGGMILSPVWGDRATLIQLARVKPAPRVAPLSAPRVTAPVAPVVADDEAFLMELEFALQHPRTRELQAFDALTPHVREIGSRSR
jgi:hypothetical protein